MDRLFLDANVLFSAAYAPGNYFLKLWRLKEVRLLTSGYALEEARRNLGETDRLKRLDRLIKAVEIVPDRAVSEFPGLFSKLDLAEKDRPILAAAISARATRLLTGDKRHFGRWFGKRLGGVLVQTPAQYFQKKSGSPKGGRTP
ncbi:MAG: PIN domain-containing protein [Planctomycetes bacterium]|nr:PIN domain-containing protein [Planctomycetota bacterium]MBU4400444.1 PIN domain-containing protein [Planctomycetota bacterium]MCG2682824.1 PIN domain-containing protein [Planctomycetales bacterium]